MAKGLSIIAGLTRVDDRAPYYADFLGGFDGRSGCEGVPLDLQRMEQFLHYHGYHSVTGRPLQDESATADRFLTAIKEASRGLDADDTLIIYLSCHGRYLGGGGSLAPELIDMDSINQFLLFDRPVYNYEILKAIADGKPNATSKIVTIIDSCHAGIGIGLVPYLENTLKITLKNVIEEKSKTLGKSALFLSEIQKIVGSYENDLLTLNQILISQITGQVHPELRSRLEANLSFSLLLLQIELRSFLVNPRSLIDCDYVHFGASRSRLTARGGADGSLFTRRLMWILKEIPEPGAWDIYESLLKILPQEHEPVIDLLPSLGEPFDCRKAYRNQFWLQFVIPDGGGVRFFRIRFVPYVDSAHYCFKPFLKI